MIIIMMYPQRNATTICGIDNHSPLLPIAYVYVPEKVCEQFHATMFATVPQTIFSVHSTGWPQFACRFGRAYDATDAKNKATSQTGH